MPPAPIRRAGSASRSPVVWLDRTTPPGLADDPQHAGVPAPGPRRRHRKGFGDGPPVDLLFGKRQQPTPCVRRVRQALGRLGRLIMLTTLRPTNSAGARIKTLFDSPRRPRNFSQLVRGTRGFIRFAVFPICGSEKATTIEQERGDSCGSAVCAERARSAHAPSETRLFRKRRLLRMRPKPGWDISVEVMPCTTTGQ